MTNHEKATHAFEAADAAHSVERALRSLAENLRRDETLDPIMLSSLKASFIRLEELIGFALDIEEMTTDAMRRALER